MSNEVTLAQLAAEMAHLRRQLETMNQRLDMIYGAVTRLADAHSPSAGPSTQAGKPQPVTDMVVTPEMMMDPGAMLDSLRQHALNIGLEISPETVERLKSHPSKDEVDDD